MWRTALLELQSENLIFKGRENIKVKVHEIDKIKVNLKRKSVLILIHGEKIYVENMLIPKVKRKYVYNLVEEKLKEKFKDIDSMLFSYKITEKNRYSLNVNTFCINRNYRKLVEKFKDSSVNIIGLIPIQFYILNKYKNRIKDENYIFLTYIEEKGYFIACCRNKVVFNEMFEINSEEEFLECLDEFILKLKLIVPTVEFNYIYSVNFYYECMSKNIICGRKFKNLGEFIV